MLAVCRGKVAVVSPFVKIALARTFSYVGVKHCILTAAAPPSVDSSLQGPFSLTSSGYKGESHVHILHPLSPPFCVERILQAWVVMGGKASLDTLLMLTDTS